MNDLSKEREAILKNIQEGSNARPREAAGVETPLHYRKLQTYLLLLYQAYLRAETALEPALKMGVWRMVQLDEGFRLKIEQTQFDILKKRSDTIVSDWEQAKDVLFPLEISETAVQGTTSKENIFGEYKEMAHLLLDYSG